MWTGGLVDCMNCGGKGKWPLSLGVHPSPAASKPAAFSAVTCSSDIISYFFVTSVRSHSVAFCNVTCPPPLFLV